MEISVHPYFLKFIRPFKLAHGAREGTQLAFVKIKHKGIEAYGEASLPPYLPETFESVKEWVLDQNERVEELLDSNPFENEELMPFDVGNTAASAALQSAILNWYAMSQEKPLSEFFEQAHDSLQLTLTITKNDFPHLDEKLTLARDFTHLKLKLTGHHDDLEFVQAIRNQTDLPFCIDINQGYQKKDEAARLIDSLLILGSDVIEQPLHRQDHDGHYWLKERVAAPIVADESIQHYEDLRQYHDAYSGVNVKLMKSGGLLQSLKMVDFTKELPNYFTLLGCMTESSLGVSVTSAIVSQFNMADLDAPYLCNNNPFDGFKVADQQIIVDFPSRKNAYYVDNVVN